MEIAIPLIALGGMYVVSNQKKKSSDTREKFTNMGKHVNYLPNTSLMQR